MDVESGQYQKQKEEKWQHLKLGATEEWINIWTDKIIKEVYETAKVKGAKR